MFFQRIVEIPMGTNCAPLLNVIFQYPYEVEIGYDLVRLLEDYPYNRYLWNNAPRPHDVIFPKRIHKNREVPISTKEHRYSHLGTHEHLRHVTFQLSIREHQYKIKLQRNDALLSHGITIKHYVDKNHQIVTKTVDHCYYHGYVKKDDWSSVAVSTCHGIRGVIHVHNETYFIQPMTGGDEGKEHPHVVFKATPSGVETCGNNYGQWMPYDQLHRGEFFQKVKVFKTLQRMGVDTNSTEKNMKLALVLDSTMYTKLNLSEPEVISYALQTVNMVDLYYKDLGVRTPVVYLEMWSSVDRFKVSTKLRELLKTFLEYRKLELQEKLFRENKNKTFDSAHFITGRELEKQSIGMAIPDSVCTDRAISINKNPDILQPQQLATVLSHMIGHNLGIKHDEEGGCVCQDEMGCIMSSKVLSHPGVHSRRFSSCSMADLEVSLNLDVASCLKNNPEPTYVQVCGNYQVERGEECDCGTPLECERTDPCCDPTTCLLKPWAQCRTGACCHNCTFLSSQYVCREKSSECDVPELCPGDSGQCPPNNYLADGHPCGNNAGYCRGGICPTLTQQCQHIWGLNASGADMQCFERFNPTGNFNGHCGKDERTNSYAKCLPENIQCGLLHCQGGNRVPLFGTDRSFSTTTLYNNNQEYNCKVIYGPAVMNLPQFGLVQDGTKCGLDKVCLSKECVPVSRLPPLECPGTVASVICSNHGVCTQAKTCFCDPGWAGPECTKKVLVTMTTGVMTSPSTTTPKPRTYEPIRVIPMETKLSTSKPSTIEPVAVIAAEENSLSTEWLIIILCSVVGGLVFILTFMFLCYRRKTPVKFTKKGFFSLRKKSSRSDDGEEAGNKVIKFGNTPSYKSDKLFGKRRKFLGRLTSEEESDIGELPPPPIIISNPDSARPERGILKNFANRKSSSDERRSSESQTERSDTTCDQESIEPSLMEDDDEINGEIQEILSRKFDPEQSMDALDQMAESSSFDFVLPNPKFSSTASNTSNSPPHRLMMYDSPFSHANGNNNITAPNSGPPRPFLWKTNPTLSPPKSKIVRMKNLDEIIHQIDRHTIDLSPSPDELQLQISPTTSEDVRSSSTEDRQYHNGHTPQSPQSITSGSTRDTYRPFMNSQWTKYILKRDSEENGSLGDLYDIESPLPSINIPPPMSPLNLKSLINYAQSTLNRDQNDTPVGSQTGECCSNAGTANSRCGYEKSSGYGSEHDPDKYSIDDISQSQSRSASASPPSYSAVIRTGPHQIQLVSTRRLQENGMKDHYNLQRMLQELPMIEKGSYERSPLCKNESESKALNCENLRNQDVPYKTETQNDPDNSLLNNSELASVNDDSITYETNPEGEAPAEIHVGEEGALIAPCIDCSLESIPYAVRKTKKDPRRPKNTEERSEETKLLTATDNSVIVT
ncbi:hypothetical protein FSP39_000858 [Pinctada imbricata]|uniref:Uncharacterized protein n=1 Tax=Pinctada imbricata TaxID=66713 RepID=A0AA89C6A2_PINIB|nr:hypothetical protein FSP39_000858 [Pinctada imbricata]